LGNHKADESALEDVMHLIDGRVVENVRVGESHFRLAFEAPPIASSVRPGQFVMVRVAPGRDPLLRRPFAVYSTRDGAIEILYRVVGRGTALLAHVSPGETLSLLGPIGTPFQILRSVNRALVVAGGIGIASVTVLLETLRSQGVDATLYYGFKGKGEELELERYRRLTAHMEISSDDGCFGRAGLVTDRITQGREEGPENAADVWYACGPVPMLRVVAREAAVRGMACQVSLEARMACGLGVCLGCAVQTVGQGYRRVCRDGPVFHASEIVWEELPV